MRASSVPIPADAPVISVTRSVMQCAVRRDKGHLQANIATPRGQTHSSLESYQANSFVGVVKLPAAAPACDCYSNRMRGTPIFRRGKTSRSPVRHAGALTGCVDDPAALLLVV